MYRHSTVSRSSTPAAPRSTSSRPSDARSARPPTRRSAPSSYRSSSTTDDDADAVLDQSVFKPVWDVLKALALPRRGTRQPTRRIASRSGAHRRPQGSLPGKIVFDLPTTVGVEFAERFTTRLVDATTTSWEYWFGLLEAFAAREGHARVPQRSRRGGRSARHVGEHPAERLQGWTSVGRSESTRLRSTFPDGRGTHVPTTGKTTSRSLEAFVAREGHARVPARHVDDGTQLGSWVNIQRALYRAGSLSASRATRLEALPGWSWDPFADQWEDNFALLEAFVAREGHARVPTDHVEDGTQLGKWVIKQRTTHKAARMAASRAALLDALPGWSWGARGDQWEANFALLEVFVAREGHARVPIDHVENGVRLGQWLSNQRARKGRHSKSRVARLDAFPGWSWGARADQWDNHFAALEAFVAREGHARVPVDHIEGDAQIGKWVVRQRTAYKNGSLSTAAGPAPQSAQRMVLVRHRGPMGRHLRAARNCSSSREGHARVPQAHVEEGTQLGSWVGTQRASYKNGSLSTSRVARLDALQDGHGNRERTNG